MLREFLGAAMSKSIIMTSLLLTTSALAGSTVLPLPSSVKTGTGTFELTANATITYAPASAQATAEFLASVLRPATGFRLPVNAGTGGAITLSITDDASTGDEGYQLIVDDGIRISANAPAGLFYGAQTLRQLLPVESFDATEQAMAWEVPRVDIADGPRFAWRGLMLDASRHFQCVEYVKHYLDAMAVHKLNRFHWHLVDGHGWRIEIKKYPRLTETGAWRNQPGYPEPGRTGRYGGYYTQEEISEIVRYAADRHITVVPEIEMPGHSWAAIAAYPELGCLGAEQEVAYFFDYPCREQRFPQIPGTDVFCTGNEKVFTFLEDVLAEVMELFPSRYIHIGGDEVDKKHWRACTRCRARKTHEGLEDEDQLQSYFIKRMERFLNAHDRALIGWDEILEGGVAPNATVMSWRGVEGGIAAARQGHDVVMTPQRPLYFDHGQSTAPHHPAHWPGLETLEEVYAYDPVPAELTPPQREHILGAQGNMWTVFTHTGELIDLMTYPRACALSEITWSPVAVKNWEDFQRRLAIHQGRLERMGINYYREIPDPGPAPRDPRVRTEDPDEGTLHPLLAGVINAGPYGPKWASLVTHPMPAWFAHDKIGLSAHWGPYSVPGWTPRKDSPYGVAYAEWYWEWLKQNDAVKAYHKRHYGEARYDDFIDGTRNLVTGDTDGFFAENFDADAWMRRFKDAGVRYFYITSKHHDGFCLWDTQYTDRNAMKMGPRRDLYGELVTAARRHGLRIGLYYSLYEWNNPLYRDSDDLQAYQGCKALVDQDRDGRGPEYVDDFMVPQIKELIDTYHPDYICLDGEWDHGYLYWRARQLAAYFYNQAAERGQEVVINDRFGQRKEGTSDTRGVYGDFRHVEYHATIDRDQPWAMWRGFGNSFGYNRNEHPDNILSVPETIRMMVEIVSQNGNVEFNLTPKADGTFPAFERERLDAMGRWLATHGEGIYGTQKGPLKPMEWGVSTVADDRLYLHVFNWPDNGELVVPGLLSDPRDVRFLHADAERLPWKRVRPGVIAIDLGDSRPFEYVSTLRLRFSAPPETSRDILPDPDGVLHLTAQEATLSGALALEHKAGADAPPNIGYWGGVGDAAMWRAVVEPGTYRVELVLAVQPGHQGGTYELVINQARLTASVGSDTGGWASFRRVTAGTIQNQSAGSVPIELKATAIPPNCCLMNLRRIRLIPVQS